MRHKEKSSAKQVIVFAIVLLICFAFLFAGANYLDKKDRKPDPVGDLSTRNVEQETIEVDGKQYAKKNGLTTILFMGVDKDTDEESVGFRNGGQADFLVVVVIDSKEHTVAQIQIDRDTMTPITILGVLGNRAGTRTTQVCLAHSFGDGGKQSCELTVEAVENLLLGIDINQYISMNMRNINLLNDSVGGVTVEIEDDFSEFDSTMVPGANVTLRGEQAELFVRSRMAIGNGTNEQRMRRQRVYLSALSEKLRESMKQDNSYISGLYDAMESVLITNIPRGKLINEAWAARDYEVFEMVRPDGEYTIGEDGFKEFHADEEALKRMVLEIFYREV